MGRTAIRPQHEELCRHCYTELFLDYPTIAKIVKVAERTVRVWGQEGKWNIMRRENLKKRTSLNTELYELAMELTSSIRDNIRNSIAPAQSVIYLLTGVLGRLDRIKVYEDMVNREKEPDEPEKPQELTEEQIINLRKQLLNF